MKPDVLAIQIEHSDVDDEIKDALQVLVASHAELLETCKAALDLFATGHAIDSFNWGASILKAENIRELNELPGLLRRSIQKAKAI